MQPPPGGGGWGPPPGAPPGYPPGGGAPPGYPPGGGAPPGYPPGGGAPPGYPPGAPPGPAGWGGGPPAGPPGGYGVGLPPGVAAQTAFPQTAVEPMGIISIILGVLSIPLYFCCGLFSIVLNLVGVVLGFVSMSRINSKPQQFSGKGLAIAGMAVNGLLLLLNIVLTILVFGVMGLGILTSP